MSAWWLLPAFIAGAGTTIAVLWWLTHAAFDAARRAEHEYHGDQLTGADHG